MAGCFKPPPFFCGWILPALLAGGLAAAPARAAEAFEDSEERYDFQNPFQDPHLIPNFSKELFVLILKKPVSMAKAYMAGFEAKKMCSDCFEALDSNGPGDACRHFAWAALLYKDIGPALSERVFSAHEIDSQQTELAREMDMANNFLGLAAAERLKKSGRLEPKEIMAAFYEDLQSGNLSIIQAPSQTGSLCPLQGS